VFKRNNITDDNKSTECEVFWHIRTLKSCCSVY